MFTSVVVVALVLTLPWTVLAAPSMQASVDIKSLAITKADLKTGFEVVPDRTVSEERRTAWPSTTSPTPVSARRTT